jgi:hypothetical protein
VPVAAYRTESDFSPPHLAGVLARRKAVKASAIAVEDAFKDFGNKRVVLIKD